MPSPKRLTVITIMTITRPENVDSH